MAYDKGRSQYLLALGNRTPEQDNELVKLNEGLIGMQLKKFALLNEPDAISIAYEALYNAIKTFDNTRDSAFSTYAIVCIYNSLGSYLRSKKTKSNIDTISYDTLVGDVTMEYFLSSDNTADSDILQRCGISDITKCIARCLHEVHNNRHKEILGLWINSQFKLTNLEIANKLNCSQSYVNQIINKFRKNLKDKLKGC